MSASPLKLQVADQDDLVVLSALLQDATVLIGDMAHDLENGQFLMVAARHSDARSGDKDESRRHLTGVNFSGIKSVRRKGFAPQDRDDVLNLLALTCFDGGIEVVFSGEATIRLECQRIRVYAADLGEGWHTAFHPEHSG